MTGSKDQVPEWCESVSLECPVEGTVYGYYPSLGWNVFFAAAFGLAFILQVGLGIRYKTWTYMIGVGLGCLGELIGYIGRIQMHNNPYDNNGFTIQIVLLIFSPAFLAAGIYLTLKHIVINFGEQWSRLKPNWYTYIFIACDITSLVLQSAGGALAATADDNDQKALDAGTDIMIGGIIFQVVVLAIFAAIVLEYSFRTYRRRSQLSPEALSLWSSTKFRLFVGAVVVAYFGILIRCIYRIPELMGGWANDIMRNEPEFIVLEGVMILVTVVAQTAFHPGWFFPALGGTLFNKKKGGAKSMSESETEMAAMALDLQPVFTFP
ncbi:RTA1-domain-containing protein [Karstenula rhodostoma CBS 690.94]|uniref:RTA1-domain-containing protein n=1 Tax=Karstenula rhodostoma CBS 690.94 TaxID=1392251 RepID=A0A9P4UB89_9PLEO|nr:RTA1-domain-containing protein [Karstenula rhodostoma CBS 690.94]